MVRHTNRNILLERPLLRLYLSLLFFFFFLVLMNPLHNGFASLSWANLCLTSALKPESARPCSSSLVCPSMGLSRAQIVSVSKVCLSGNIQLRLVYRKIDKTKPNNQLKVYRFRIPASVKASDEGSFVPPLTIDRARPGKRGVTGTMKARILWKSASGI